MKTVTAKDLRFRTSRVLEDVGKGEEILVTLRGKPAAILKPLDKEERHFERIGFGIWAERADMADVSRWVHERRRERHDAGRSDDAL